MEILYLSNQIHPKGFICGFKASNRVKSLLLITLFREEPSIKD